jgi:hypothetical protein
MGSMRRFLRLRGIDQGHSAGGVGRARRNIPKANQEVGEHKRRLRRGEGIGGNLDTSDIIEDGEVGGVCGDGSPDGTNAVSNVLHNDGAVDLHERRWGVGGQVEQTDTGARGNGDVRCSDCLHIGVRAGWPEVLDHNHQGTRGQRDDGGQEQAALGTVGRRVDVNRAGAILEDLNPAGELTKVVVVPRVGKVTLADRSEHIVCGGDSVAKTNVRLRVGRQRGLGSWRGGGRRCSSGGGGGCGRGGGRGCGRVGVVCLADGNLEGVGNDGVGGDAEINRAERAVVLTDCPASESLAAAKVWGVDGGAGHHAGAEADRVIGDDTTALGKNPLPGLPLGTFLGNVHVVAEVHISLIVGAAVVIRNVLRLVVVVAPGVNAGVRRKAREDVTLLVALTIHLQHPSVGGDKKVGGVCVLARREGLPRDAGKVHGLVRKCGDDKDCSSDKDDAHRYDSL